MPSYLYQGRGLSPLPTGEVDGAQLFGIIRAKRTLQIRQIIGFGFSIATSILPLQASPILS